MFSNTENKSRASVHIILPLLFNAVPKVLARAIRHKKIKGTQINQGDVKLSLFTDDMLLSTKKPMESTRIELHSPVHFSLLVKVFTFFNHSMN